MLKPLVEQYWQSWGLKEKPTLVKQFTDGKNHTTGLLQSAGEFYVLKQFNHSAVTAVHAQQAAAQHGIAPRIVFHDQDLCVMEYVPHSKPSLDQIALSLNTLHTDVKCEASGLELMTFYDEYLSTAPENLKKQHGSLLPIVKEFINDPTPWCFCHNDLVTENCLADNKTAIFIDWEFAANHNPWFDIAAIILYQDLDQNRAKLFLQSYRGWQSKIEERIFLSSQITLLWADLLWHVNNYGSEYQRKESSRFEKLQRLSRQLGNL